MSRRRSESVLPQHPVGHSLRALTKWAVAASLGAAACSAQQELPVGSARAAAGVGNAGSAVLSGGTGGSAGASKTGAAGGSASAGSTGTAGGGAGADALRIVTCTMERADLFATPIMPARAFEYAAAFLSIAAGSGMAGPYPARLQAVGETGQPCAGAADSGACKQTLSMLSALDAACVDDKLCTPFVVTTEGSDVRRIESERDLLDWLGSIDTPSEAVFVATFKGLTPNCEITSSRFSPENGRGTLVQEQADGYVVISEWQKCDKPKIRETVKIARDGSSAATERMEIGPVTCTSGRRPAGLQLTASRLQPSAAGSFLAQAATLEAASVHAFQQLARELSKRAAPNGLIAWAARSALEEVVHTQLMAAQAARYGATPLPPRILPQRPRSLFELALENAVEGCIRETYGALVAHQQATLARDPELARVMRVIARDETCHAELSWQIAA